MEMGHAVRLGDLRHRLRLSAAALRGRGLWGPQGPHGGGRQAARLCVEPGDLLHLLDLFRRSGPGGATRAGVHRHLYRPDPDVHARPAGHPPDHRARQGRAADLGRRFRRRALWQEPGRGGDRRADFARRRHSLYRAAAQGRFRLGGGTGRHQRLWHRRAYDGRADHRSAGLRRTAPARHAVSRLFRHHFRDAPHRRDRAPGRADPGDRHGIGGQAGGPGGGRSLCRLRAVRRPGGPDGARGGRMRR